MSRITRTSVFWLVLLLSPLRASAEPQGHAGFTRLYVVQPGPAAADGGGGGVRVSSVSSRPGYSVELGASYGGPLRTRRMGGQGGPVPPFSPHKQTGVNVCGGQCCHGWSKAQGSQRCTKPNCIPQCQNGGMCLGPQLCVCKPGSNGKACEEKTPFPAPPGNGHTNGHDVVPQRPIPQQAPPDGYAALPSNMAQMKLTVKSSPHFIQPHYIQQHIQQRIHSIPAGQSQQYVIKQPKYYQTHTTHTQTHVQSQPERPIPLSAGHNPIHVGNHTGRIKVVFTPTICKLTCVGGRCHNNCKLGNTTTIVSENGHATDTLTAPNFRVVVCHLPCINGGKCSARDKCQCPPSFTGKFCQRPVQNGHQQQQQQQQTSGSYSQTQIHSTHTLPLTYSHSQSPVFSPSIVNVHIKHPPEASVQVHQVSQLDHYQNGGHQLTSSQSGSSSSSSYSSHHTESSHKIQHHGYNIVLPVQHGYHVSQSQPFTSKNTLGRCFQETAGSQCGKALPGLTKQEQCCGTIGTSWGFHKCQKCPNKPSIPLIDCPRGYKRINSSHCQDVDECQLHGVCPNGQCVNTVGSYRCACNPGFVPDPTLTACMSSARAVHEEKGSCFRLVGSGRQCLHPVSAQLSKQLCCCSVGKAWGPRCDRCPPPGTAKFKEICPGGMGYTILPNPPVSKPVTVPQEPTDPLPARTLPTPATTAKTFGTAEEVIREVVEKSSPPSPVEILPSNAGQDIGPTQSTEVDECHFSPYICGQGVCYNTAEGYTCHCHEGYRLDDTHSTCVDVDECQEQKVCSRGLCHNTEGSFTCQCGRGFRATADGNHCHDADECADRAELCSPHGTCVNTDGSYQCVCDSGFTANVDTTSCDDIDECGLNDTRCGPHGFCENRLGSFRCLCDQGYQESLDGHSCVDVNECDLLGSVCGEAQCVNVEGSFLCVCPDGRDYNVMTAECEPVPTAPPVERKDCYYQLNDENLCESVLSSHITLQECCCTLGAGWGDNCEVHPCPVNGTDQFNQMCPSGRGFILHGDLQNGVPPPESYQDADECSLFGDEVCKGGFCLDTVGSYECYCKSGQDYDVSRLECRDIDECLDETLCAGGKCVNTDGSFMCFCSPPMVLEPLRNRCVLVPDGSEPREADHTAVQGVCWQAVTDNMTCSLPLASGRTTTYSECCCLFGEAWGMECALCPARDSEHFAFMCNDEEPPERSEHRAFEGLQADECGILNGCENGRCVRVQEGYTCDCFDGFALDLSRMACVDVDECSELNGRMLLCRNARCINTPGSYRCECLPGFRASDQPEFCTLAH